MGILFSAMFLVFCQIPPEVPAMPFKRSLDEHAMGSW